MRFDACATDYDTHAAPQRAFATRVAEFAAIAEREEVLEFGAGTGALTTLLCNVAGVRVRATDLSPAMVRIGRAAAPGAEWTILDAFEGPIPTSHVQISSGLLQWAPDPIRVLRSWAAALQPGGRMIHAFPSEPCLKEWRDIVPESPIAWRDDRAWEEIFNLAGLRINRRRLWMEQHTFDSAHDMIKGMHQSGVTSKARLNPGRLRQCLRTYDRLHRAAGGGVSATWAWLAIEAAPRPSP